MAKPKEPTLEGVIAELAKIDAADLIREAQLGDLNFQTEYPTAFEPALSVCRQFASYDLSFLPAAKRDQLLYHFNELKKNLGFVRSYDPKKNSPEDRKTFVDRVSRFHEHFNDFAPVLAYAHAIHHLSLKQPGVQRLEAALAAELDELTQLRAHAESGMEAIRAASQDAAITAYASAFEDEANVHMRSASTWLKAAVFFGVLSFLAATGLVIWYYVRPPVLGTAQAIQVGIAKALALSILVSGLVWSGRSYRAHRHNEVVNRHRHNALRTFRALMEGSKDERTKDSILVQAAQCMFGPQATGYDASGPDVLSFSNVLDGARAEGG